MGNGEFKLLGRFHYKQGCITALQQIKNERNSLLTKILLLNSLNFQGFLEIVPERAGIEYVNKKYVQSVSINVRKTGRGGIYVANVDFDSNSTFGNNMTVSF